MKKSDRDDQTPTLSRRGFLGLCAGLGGAGLGMRSFDVLADVVPHQAESWTQGQVVPSICSMCVNRCGIRCRVIDGVLHKIEGDPKNPKSQGGTCAKGQAGVMQLYDPDRVKYPMIRVGERGEGKWRKATWEEAFDYTAKGLTKVIDEHGAGSLFWSSTTDLTEKFFVKFGTYLGTQNFARHATLCLSSRNVGYFGTMGGVPEMELDKSKYIVMFGANRLESFELPYNIDLITGLKNGAKLVVVDPRQTFTAAKGQWVPIRPRTDMALVFGLMHVLITEELYDKEFVANRTVGFEELKAHVADKTPAWAAQETDIPADTIVTMAREMAAAAPHVAIFPGRRTSWYTNDTQFRRAASMLTGLIGAVDAPGAAFFSGQKAKLGELGWAIEPFDITPRFDHFDEKFPLAHHEDGGYVHMRDAIVDGKAAHPVKGWMIYHQNPLAAVLDQHKTMEMLKQMEFIGVIDIQMSQTAWYADIVLPEHTYLERLDPIWAPGDIRRAHATIRQPVVKPVHDSKSILEIVQGIGKQIDKLHTFDPPIAEAFNFSMEDYVDAQLKPLGIDRATMMKQGIWLDDDKPVAYGALRSGKADFKTPSGKLEFVSERFVRNGYPGLPEYEPLKVEEGKQRLVTGRHAWFTHSFNQNNQWLASLYPENEAWINPEVAKAKGIANGDYIKVKSERGEIRIKALVTARIRPDTLFICHGFGSESGGHGTSGGKGGADQVLMSSAADEISNNQAMHETFVEVSKA